MSSRPEPAVFCPKCGAKFTGLFRLFDRRKHMERDHGGSAR